MTTYTILGLKRKNSREYKKEIFKTNNETLLINYIKENKYAIGESPHIFTHIPIHLEGEDFVLFQDYNGMTVSPEALYKTLTSLK